MDPLLAGVVDRRSICLATADEEGKVDFGKTAEVRIEQGSDNLRIILEPWGDDHDVLIERYANHWKVYFHPSGGDPLCVIEAYADHTVVTDDCGRVLTTVGP